MHPYCILHHQPYLLPSLAPAAPEAKIEFQNLERAKTKLIKFLVTDKDDDSDEESQSSQAGSGSSEKPKVEAAAAPASAAAVAAAVALEGKRIVMCGTTLETLNGARGKCESVNETTGACKVKLDVPRLAQVNVA